MYKWNTDYNTTISAVPTASKQFVNFSDNQWLEINFAPQTAGDYLWVLNNPSETVGVWKYDGSNNSSTAYLNGSIASGDYMSKISNKADEYYYIRNAQGDIIGLYSQLGTQVVSYTYDTWGKLISTTGTLASTVGAKNPYLYRGYRYDSETGLYYLQSRYYNPDWGRFINADASLSPGGVLLGANMFAYCKNNPATLSDPSGEFAIFAAALICGFVGAVVGGTTSAIMQYATTGQVDFQDVAIAAGVGFVAGALTPFVGVSAWGIAGLGAASNVVQTTITNFSHGKSTSLSDVAIGVATGAVSGVFGGKFIKPKGGYDVPTHYGGDLPLIPRDSILVKMQRQEVALKSAMNSVFNTVTFRNFSGGLLNNGGLDKARAFTTKRINIFQH